MGILLGAIAKPAAKALSNTNLLGMAAKKAAEKMEEKKKKSSATQPAQKMAHGGMTCRGKGAAKKGAKYKG